MLDSLDFCLNLLIKLIDNIIAGPPKTLFRANFSKFKRKVILLTTKLRDSWRTLNQCWIHTTNRTYYGSSINNLHLHIKEHIKKGDAVATTAPAPTDYYLVAVEQHLIIEIDCNI